MDFSFPTFRPFLASWWPWRTTPEQSRMLLRLIAVAAEDNLPLSPLLLSWASDEHGRQKGRLFRLVRLINEGSSLADAVEATPGVLRDEEILAIRFDAQSGTRTAAIRAHLDRVESPLNPQPAGVGSSFFYFSFVLLVSLLNLVFLQMVILPALSKIAADFSLPVLPVLSWSMYLGDVLSSLWWLIALAICLVLWLVYSTGAGRLARRTLRGLHFNPWRDSYVADVLRNLCVATSSGRPLAGAIATLARYHFDPVIRHKLLYVRNEVELGAEMWQSMNVAGLLTKPEVHLLHTAERIGNRGWVLTQLASIRQGRLVRRWQRRSTLILPGFVLVMGGFVLFQAFTVFSPLVHFLRQF